MLVKSLEGSFLAIKGDQKAAFKKKQKEKGGELMIRRWASFVIAFIIVVVGIQVVVWMADLVWERERTWLESQKQGVLVPFSDQPHTSVVAVSFEELEGFLSKVQIASLAIGISPEKEGMRALYVVVGSDGKPRFAAKTLAEDYFWPKIVETESGIMIVGGEYDSSYSTTMKVFGACLGLVCYVVGLGIVAFAFAVLRWGCERVGQIVIHDNH